MTVSGPPVDFNGNGFVDIGDLLRLIESWGHDDPTVDIGPAPFGDGIIDAADLEVLMGYWGQEVNDPTLVARWAFDETEGMFASDSVGDHDAAIVGTPLWQPTAGAVHGALELDGVTHATTELALDPAEGPFSVLAWVKGGGPGQVLLSQAGGANWLLASVPEGRVETELKSTGRQSRALTSETGITDGNWHRVGITWDGQTRVLYVDDIEVALDTQPNLASCSGGLNIGCGKDMAPDTFWSGLIDDVRIYSRAVRPASK